MSDDVSVARDPRAVSAITAKESTWTVGPRLWEAYFAVCLLATSALTYLVETTEPVRERQITLGLYAAMAAWYVVLGGPVVRAQKATGRGLVFQVGLLALFAAALVVVGTSSFLLFGLCPLAYMTLRFRQAHVAVAVYAFTPALVGLVLDGPQSLRPTLPIGAVAFVISLVIATTTKRAERTSEERAVLIEELESTRAELARLSREAGIAEERQRLAGDIHDTVAQGLSSVVMLVEAADAALGRDPEAARGHLRLAARTARENLYEARAIVGALTPSPLAEATLADALRRLAERFAHETGVTASMLATGAGRPLPTGTEVVLLRVAQEALNNVRKHAGAGTAGVELRYLPDRVVVEVRDDGVGFDVSALAPGYGLGAMQARVEQIGGRLSITSTPGSGTTLRTEVAT